MGGITIKIEEILDKVIKICILHSAKSVYLFGSRAKGTFRERSDIDIAVSGADDMEMLKVRNELAHDYDETVIRKSCEDIRGKYLELFMELEANIDRIIK